MDFVFIFLLFNSMSEGVGEDLRGRIKPGSWNGHGETTGRYCVPVLIEVYPGLNLTWKFPNQRKRGLCITLLHFFILEATITPRLMCWHTVDDHCRILKFGFCNAGGA